MRRLLYADLEKWKETPTHLPVILQGARQCGKTWLLKTFGENAFEDCAYFNFEHTPQLKDIFASDLDVHRIVSTLSLLRKKTIETGKTLVIFDEVQMCPRALTALKYFAEDLPALHIAAAGSLLGVALSQMGAGNSYPVGKVKTLTLRPLNFEEFLLAHNEDLLIDHVRTNPYDEAVQTIFAPRLESLLRDYLITGGMPASVQAWITSGNIGEVEEILTSIAADYEKDFVKYAHASEYPKLLAVWEGIPAQLARDNRKFVFSRIKTGARARDLEDALYWLLGAGIVQKVAKIERPLVPCSAYADLSYFKMYLSDVGILRKLAGFGTDVLFSSDEATAYIRGMLTENFVLSELLASALGSAGVWFWRSNNSAEVDFVIQCGSSVVPIEVKAGKNTRSRSLGEYRKKFAPAAALRLSLMPAGVHKDNFGTVVDLPLYLLWAGEKYLSGALSGQSGEIKGAIV
ncbi:MAG TPA: ATP-binding protein [Methanocorpusculum sp.]|nr:ATP-binding protein [Methanocorpusculum sp.]